MLVLKRAGGGRRSRQRARGLGKVAKSHSQNTNLGPLGEPQPARSSPYLFVVCGTNLGLGLILLILFLYHF